MPSAGIPYTVASLIVAGCYGVETTSRIAQDLLQAITRKVVVFGCLLAQTETTYMSMFLVVLIGTFWYTVQGLPGISEAVGYFFGLLLASYSVEYLPAPWK